MEYKSNQHRQMAKVKNILSQIFFPKRLESSSHESYSGSCGDHAQWNLNPENGELRITGTGPLYDFFGEKEVPWESHLNHIRKVVVAHGITYIGFQAFSYCKSLSSVQLPDTLTGIGQHAFAYCKSLTSVLLPEGVKHIKDYAFAHCYHLQELTLPATLKSIGKAAFCSCHGLTRISIPDNAILLGSEVFADCKNLTEIKLPEGLLQLKSNSFAGCISLASVSLPPTVAYLGNSAFEGCNSFTRIDIPDKIVHIGDRVFADCHALEQITIPPSVHHLGKHIFSGCRSLKTLTVPFPACGTPATFSNFGELFGTTPDIEMRKISQDNETGKETNYYLPHSLSVLRILEGCEIIPSKCLMNCFVLKELPPSVFTLYDGRKSRLRLCRPENHLLPSCGTGLHPCRHLRRHQVQRLPDPRPARFYREIQTRQALETFLTNRRIKNNLTSDEPELNLCLSFSFRPNP